MWEVLGPLPVGKLEVDADPTFDGPSVIYGSSLFPDSVQRDREKALTEDEEEFYGERDRPETWDPVLHVLTMPFNGTVASELLPGGEVSWTRAYNSEEEGGCRVRWDAQWHELAQALGTTAAFEAQGWARGITYAHSAGPHQLFVSGAHTVYVRNGGQTRVAAGDVYGAGTVVSSLDLAIGPVAIIIPLRGRGGVHFSVHLSQSPLTAADSLVLLPPRLLPNLLQLASGTNEGGQKGDQSRGSNSNSATDSQNPHDVYLKRLCDLQSSSFESHFPMQRTEGNPLLQSDSQSCLRAPASTRNSTFSETKNGNGNASAWDVATAVRKVTVLNTKKGQGQGLEKQGLLISGVFALPVHNTQVRIK